MKKTLALVAAIAAASALAGIDEITNAGFGGSRLVWHTVNEAPGTTFFVRETTAQGVEIHTDITRSPSDIGCWNYRTDGIQKNHAVEIVMVDEAGQTVVWHN